MGGADARRFWDRRGPKFRHIEFSPAKWRCHAPGENRLRTHGRLAADRRNAVLIGHGHTSSHHAAGRNSANGNLPGWWDGLIGSGKVIDTDRLSVVSSNMLGSSFGSSNGANTDPQTGKPYRLDFPRLPCAVSSRLRGLCSARSVSSTSSPLPAHPIAAARPSNGQSTTLSL